MEKILINLHMIANGNWVASIASENSPKGAKSAIASGGFQVTYGSKQQAWETISERASLLNYTDNEVFFNLQSVDSYDDVVVLEAVL